MIVGVPKEGFPGERRVALVPVVVPNLIKAGFQILVEAGAGASAGYPDADYVEKGAKLAASRAEVFQSADVIVQVLSYGSNDVTGKDDLAAVSPRPDRHRLPSSLWLARIGRSNLPPPGSPHFPSN